MGGGGCKGKQGRGVQGVALVPCTRYRDVKTMCMCCAQNNEGKDALKVMMLGIGWQTNDTSMSSEGKLSFLHRL